MLFTADHGEMLGERGLWYKMCFFEQSARVPLIVRRPGGSGARVREPVSLVDVAPTLLSLAGVPADPGLGLEGVDLAGVIRGDGPGPERPADHPGRDLGHRPAQPVPAVDRARPVVDRRLRTE